MLTCIFCGANEPASYKQLGHSYVLELLQRQKDTGVCEPVLNFMWSTLHNEAGAGDGHAGDGHAGDGHAGDGHAGDGHAADAHAGDAQLFSCMCCYYWVERRRSMLVVPLPMQNLLWFMKTLSWCEGKKCDSRILQRLVETVAAPGNVFAALFDDCELLALRRLAGELAARRQRSAEQRQGGAPSEQAQRGFCIKSALAAFWSEQNGDCLCLPHAGAADLLRQSACVEDCAGAPE
jgi:hypothetical protein